MPEDSAEITAEQLWNKLIASAHGKTDENENQVSMKGKNSVTEWNPNEYEKLIYLMRKAGLIKDNRVGRASILLTNSFKGEDFVRWVVEERKIKRKDALDIGQQLIYRQFAQAFGNEFDMTFSAERYYQLKEEDLTAPLNSGQPSNNCTTNVGEYNKILCKIIQPVYDSVLSADKKFVYYDLLEDNEHFIRYLSLIKEAVNLDVDSATVQERLAFFINICNMHVLHTVYKYGLPQTIWQRRKYQNSIYYQIGGHLYSLQSMFNGILRGNRKGLDMLWPPFGDEDPRKQYYIKGGEPLVHFAVTNLTKSTPPILAYSSKNIYQELRSNARRCLYSEDFLKVDQPKLTIKFAKLFKRYSRDFGPDTENQIEWILNILLDDTEQKQTLLKTYQKGKYSISYLQFNADINMIRGPKPSNGAPQTKTPN